MTADPIILPPGVSFAIIAFLLALLPAGLFIWLWYLRRVDRPVPTKAVGLSFLAGLLVVWPAFRLEQWASHFWYYISPATAHYFAGTIRPLQSWLDILLPALGTFAVVALVEEGLRYLVLSWWFRAGKDIDQVFDGIVIGIAMGLGFATLENTFYFVNLFTRGSFDTLIFVFFLRFMISTLAHISFAGLMGGFLARAVFAIYPLEKRRLYNTAIFIPWFLHGLYDLLLGLELTTYAVLLLLPPLLVLISWMNRRDFFAISRAGGKVLVMQRPPDNEPFMENKYVNNQFESPWNKHAPWLHPRRINFGLKIKASRQK